MPSTNTRVRQAVYEALRQEGLQGNTQAQRVADRVVEQISGFASQAADQIKAAARQRGMRDNEVNTVLVQAGLVTEEPVQSQSSAQGGDLERRVATLEQIARQRGLL